MACGCRAGGQERSPGGRGGIPLRALIGRQVENHGGAQRSVGRRLNVQAGMGGTRVRGMKQADM